MGRLVKPITITLSVTETLLLLGALRVAANTKIANDIDKGILEDLLNRISKKVIEESEVK